MPKNSNTTPPTTWLWQEIERRFGQEAAADLHRAFNLQMKLYEREQTLQAYRRDLPSLEARLARARAENRATKNLENKIALRKYRLQYGWSEEDGDSADV